MVEVSKLRFEFKEVAYIVMATIAYFTQLSILSTKIEDYKHKCDMSYQEFEFRITALELASHVAILPVSPSIKKEDE